MLAVHRAADGGLARIRLPGGTLSAEQLGVLATAATDLGDGRLELTSRANVQIRGLEPGSEQALSDSLYAVGLLPSMTHERVRNILASPLAGLDAVSQYDVRPFVAQLDRLLCARADLAELPGRFLFALDDGRGDLTALKADAGIQALPGGRVALVLGGIDTGVRADRREATGLLLATARAFLAERAEQKSEAWRLTELDDGITRVLARLRQGQGPATSSPPAPPEALATAGPVRAGRHSQADGRIALVVTVPLGSLTADHVAALGEVAAAGQGAASGQGVAAEQGAASRRRVAEGRGVAAGQLAASGQRSAAGQRAASGQVAAAGQRGAEGWGVRVTPWRSVVLPGVPADQVEVVEAGLTRAGLVVDPESGWGGVTACAGQPGCAKALADVRADARRATVRLVGIGKPVHWSGCDRRCGHPAGEMVDVVADGNGYLVDGIAVDQDGVGELIAARRRIGEH
ncbi:precorrin-3B synthase [Kribbella sp. NBC_01245]|uniref:precorrin-3B synthase n=1 Tax=Kribbella sp. NBC_01245 TaxID=2903578 RepID=UPI002E29C878|nr:precorrin-3B synthase [Kribbella sp. NBC_01245]